MNHSLRFAKTFSTKIIPKGWVKFNGNPAIRVTIKDCDYATDFIKNIKQELAPKFNNTPTDEITLHISEKSSPLSPGVSIAEALKNVIFRLILKLCRNATLCQSSSAGSAFLSYFVKDYLYSALYQVTNPKDRITMFKQLIDGEKYNVYSRYERSFAKETFFGYETFLD
jgi:hypothetical protein